MSCPIQDGAHLWLVICTRCQLGAQLVLSTGTPWFSVSSLLCMAWTSQSLVAGSIYLYLKSINLLFLCIANIFSHVVIVFLI